MSQPAHRHVVTTLHSCSNVNVLISRSITLVSTITDDYTLFRQSRIHNRGVAIIHIQPKGCSTTSVSTRQRQTTTTNVTHSTQHRSAHVSTIGRRHQQTTADRVTNTPGTRQLIGPGSRSTHDHVGGDRGPDQLNPTDTHVSTRTTTTQRQTTTIIATAGHCSKSV